ncbi:class I SAM-dependent methyltransferase [Pelagibius sp. CAU 1746]|uniref:class I SAM-dependent methyltransferase n=1 Tax=Pelagibius sp. CAU 1746 TaxID=3140370 RepID=UPI00325C1434
MTNVRPSYSLAARSYHARTPYIPAFFKFFAAKLIHCRDTSLLDLGAGPGPLAAGFAPYVSRAVLLDSDPSMLGEARCRRYALGCEVTFLECPIELMPEDAGDFDLVTIGRALHWLPREATLKQLSRHVRAGGHVIVCESGTVAPETPWYPAFRAARHGTFSGKARDLGRTAPAFFSDTDFRNLGERVWRAENRISVDTLVERMFSYSLSGRDKLGDEAAAREAQLRESLAPYETPQGVHEVIYNRALVFRRI